MSKTTKSLFARKGIKVITGILVVTFVSGVILTVSGLVSADTVWSYFLEFFGKASVTGDVKQSVLLNDGEYVSSDGDGRKQDYSTNDIFGGETTISIHNLENRSSVEQDVALVTSYYPFDIDSAIETSYYELKGLEDTQNMEKVWCHEPCEDLIVGESLIVSVSYENGYVVFKATPPSDYVVETSLTTFTFDVDSNGFADFQVQYEGNGWIYSEVDEDGLVWLKDTTGWQEVPNEFITEIVDREFTLKVPVSILGGLGSDYKFGVQTNEGSPTWYQTFYPNTWNLWSTEENPSDNTVSDNYKDMTVGTAIGEGVTFTLEPNEIMDFVMSNETDGNLVCLECTVTVTVNPR